MKKLIAGTLLLATLLTVGGCQSQQPSTSQEEQGTKTLSIDYQESGFDTAPVKATAMVTAMDTLMTLTVYADDEAQAEKALTDARQEIVRIEQTLSTNITESEVARINQAGKGQFGEDGKALMKRSQEFYQKTDGLFDIAIYPLVKAWGFTTNSFQVPEPSTIQALLPICRLDLVQFDEKSGDVTLTKPDMGIDFGGIAKGYTSARLMKIFEQAGVTSGLVSLGGNVQLLHEKPDGSPYVVAIEDPTKPEDFIGTLKTRDRAVITSGAYQRFFEKDGVRYHHIIDPRTGAPSAQDLISTTVVTKDGTLGDAYSTTLYILGFDKAKAFWQAHKDEFDMILVDKNQQIYLTEGLEKDFSASEGQPAPIILKGNPS